MKPERVPQIGCTPMFLRSISLRSRLTPVSTFQACHEPGKRVQHSTRVYKAIRPPASKAAPRFGSSLLAGEPSSLQLPGTAAAFAALMMLAASSGSNRRLLTRSFAAAVTLAT